MAEEKVFLEEIKDLRHELHKHPEISGREVWTKQYLMDYLRAHTSLEIVDRQDWFYAVYHDAREKGAGSGVETFSPIAFRADFDGLPIPEKNDLPYCSENNGISHRCGHDGHAAVLAALACKIGCEADSDANCYAIPDAGRDVYFIFQHAEETGEGAENCAELIDEKGIGEIYAFHNWSGFPEKSIIIGDGIVQCASEGVTIKFTGRPAHASQPEDGNNPIFALSELVLKIREDTNQSIATAVGVNAGGEDFGIAPGEGIASFTLRAEKESEITDKRNLLLRYADEAAKKYELEWTYRESDVFPETVNDLRLAAHVKDTAEKIGLNVIKLEKPFRSSEDFGHYQKKCPGIMIYIGNGNGYPQIHTEKYDFNDDIIETAVTLMGALIKYRFC